MVKAHSFHVPVMGIGYTLDTPLKVAHFGIDSVISTVDDILMEKLRAMYCRKYALPYTEITTKIEDFRARRITAYLNLIQDLAKKNFAKLKSQVFRKGTKLWEYLDLLPDHSSIKKDFTNLFGESTSSIDFEKWINEHLVMGSIDINIMTKIDKENYRNDVKLPSEFNDAHAGLRGYANSDLKSSIVLSAGLNPRLYGYLANFNCFFPDEQGEIDKKIVLKVSDFRSAMIQGKFLAKKGLWVSEYRIESGLNCGGHAFATDGYLMGPILEQFWERRKELTSQMHELLVEALSRMNRSVPKTTLPLRISAQGGVGTAEEHRFLIDYYKVDSVGWGSPFLLVPEVTTVDMETREKLAKAKEEDLYLSDISPLGVPFNNLKGNTKDIEKYDRIEKGKPGSPCPRKFVEFNKEFTDKGICPASRQYQVLKLKQLKERGLSREQYQTEFRKVVDKSCICVGLGTAVLLENDLDTKREGKGVSVCPGPNMAYFSKVLSLEEMIDHIYGRSDNISRRDRPNVFMNELKIYIDYLENKVAESMASLSIRQKKHFKTFAQNLMKSISYYEKLFADLDMAFGKAKQEILLDLDLSRGRLHRLDLSIENQSVNLC